MRRRQPRLAAFDFDAAVASAPRAAPAPPDGGGGASSASSSDAVAAAVSTKKSDGLRLVGGGDVVELGERVRRDGVGGDEVAVVKLAPLQSQIVACIRAASSAARPARAPPPAAAQTT